MNLIFIFISVLTVIALHGKNSCILVLYQMITDLKEDNILIFLETYTCTDLLILTETSKSFCSSPVISIGNVYNTTIV